MVGEAGPRAAMRAIFVYVIQYYTQEKQIGYLLYHIKQLYKNLSDTRFQEDINSIMWSLEMIETIMNFISDFAKANFHINSIINDLIRFFFEVCENKEGKKESLEYVKLFGKIMHFCIMIVNMRTLIDSLSVTKDVRQVISRYKEISFDLAAKFEDISIEEYISLFEDFLSTYNENHAIINDSFCIDTVDYSNEFDCNDSGIVTEQKLHYWLNGVK